MGVRWWGGGGGPRGAGVGGLTGDAELLQERDRVWRGEKIVWSEQLGGGVIIVIMDTEVNDELMIRGGELKSEGVEPGERVWSLGAAGVRSGGCCWAEFLS